MPRLSITRETQDMRIGWRAHARRRGGAALLVALAGLAAGAPQKHHSKEGTRIMETEMVKVAGDLKFPEGPAYDGKGNLYCSNCNADYVTKMTAADEESIAFRANPHGDDPFTFKKTNGMTFYRDGSLFACDFERNAIIRIYMDGRQELYAGRFEGHPFEQPNDLAFDPHGNLYFTAPGGSGRAHPTGPIYRVEHGSRKVTKVAEGMAFPNGLAFTADGKHLYVCESQYNRIVRFPVHADGTLGALEPFADLAPDGPGEPDGMAVDVRGNLWIAHYGAHTLLIVDPQGKITHTIRFPHEQDGGPTNIEFAGHDLRTVYVTDPGANALWKLHSDTPGLPLFCAPPDTALTP